MNIIRELTIRRYSEIDFFVNKKKEYGIFMLQLDEDYR